MSTLLCLRVNYIRQRSKGIGVTRPTDANSTRDDPSITFGCFQPGRTLSTPPAGCDSRPVPRTRIVLGHPERIRMVLVLQDVRVDVERRVHQQRQAQRRLGSHLWGRATVGHAHVRAAHGGVLTWQPRPRGVGPCTEGRAALQWGAPRPSNGTVSVSAGRVERSGPDDKTVGVDSSTRQNGDRWSSPRPNAHPASPKHVPRARAAAIQG
jgi:hypothetical protein